jgi:enoyl-CoA hydratase/carnithine racemase
MAVHFRQEGKIAIFTIDNPSRMNSLDISALGELRKHLEAFNDNPDLWAGIITGSGENAFCSGFDINAFSSKNQSVQPQNEQAAPLRGMEISKPLIAAVNGAALGGGLELALICDLRIASEKAIFGFPEVKLGLIPSWGGTQLLSHQISSCQAAELLFTGSNIDAPTALRMGLINRVVPQDQVMGCAADLAETICRAAPLAVRAAKEALIKGRQVSPEEGLQIEAALSCYLRTTEDFHEGIAAYRQKRKPRFEGK